MARNRNRNRNNQNERFEDQRNEFEKVVTEEVVDTKEEEGQEVNTERKIRTISPSELVEKHNITEPTHRTHANKRINKLTNAYRTSRINAADSLMKERVNRILENLDRQQK